ncbi:unnamed protein product [Rotaria magnacalcarata]|uniref:Uncharacterized protein n=1 Tax=Rotaria magnacalcarata TaxID=392030 RepID=A0A815LVE0_9BILA|nr:unnamed protein product [Rotaria magnacalcarata]
MNTLTDTTCKCKPNILQKKSSIRQNTSYRVFHVTKKAKDESDDEYDLCTQNKYMADKENYRKIRYQKRSFKSSTRNGSERWKRKSARNKQLFVISKTSSESTSSNMKDSVLRDQLTNNASQLSILVNSDPTSKEYQKENYIGESSSSDVLIDPIDETISNNDATLDDLLARADKLETTVKLQDFNKIQPQVQAQAQVILYRRRKRCVIAVGTVLTILTIIIIIIVAVALTIRYKAKTDQISKSSRIQNSYR